MKMYMKAIYMVLLFALPAAVLVSCNKDALKEVPLSDLSPDNILTTKDGFDLFITALHSGAREEMMIDGTDLGPYYEMHIGTDVGTTGQEQTVAFRDYLTYLTPTNATVRRYWDWLYQKLLARANTIIEYAQRAEIAGIWGSEAEKNAVIAEAKFFRAYAHNMLANLYGGVPIADRVYKTPKTDFVKNTRKEVYEFAKQDLEFAAKWLPPTVEPAREGHIVKAAANHLLTEVYISLGEYENAIKSASNVIDSAGLYKLMTTRFGAKKNEPGDAFSDLFQEGNQNRSSGNQESIYVWQFTEFIPGGGGGTANNWLRAWGPFYINLKDPDGVAGNVLVDSLGRGVAYVRATNYFFYDVWKDNWDNDIRNSRYNIRRVQYYNNPASKYFNKVIEPRTTQEDTMRNIFPTIRKIEGRPWQNNNVSGRVPKDIMVYRLAETYLLRAEAYLRAGDAGKAAQDINAVRTRSNAKGVDAADVTLDYILDERARELIAEEPRRRTLIRMGKLVERTRKYNIRTDTKNSILDYHEFWPIPQTAIDANLGAKLEQNKGYIKN
jgi:hypothetical protein